MAELFQRQAAPSPFCSVLRLSNLVIALLLQNRLADAELSLDHRGLGSLISNLHRYKVNDPSLLKESLIGVGLPRNLGFHALLRNVLQGWLEPFEDLSLIHI